MDTKSTEIIGLIVLVVLILGGVFWYMSEHPAPISYQHGGTGTATSTESKAPLQISEQAKLYEVSGQTPGGTPIADARGNAQAVEVMHQFALTAVDAFKERGNFANLTQKDIDFLPYRDGNKESLKIEYRVAKGPHTVSYIFSMIEDTFGAHPNVYFRTFTFDLETGTSLDLGDLFTPSADYLTTLSKKSRAALPGILAKISGEDKASINTDFIQSGTQPYPDSFQSWYVDGTSLVLLFPPYQVAAYVYGAPEVKIPFSELSSARARYK